MNPSKPALKTRSGLLFFLSELEVNELIFASLEVIDDRQGDKQIKCAAERKRHAPPDGADPPLVFAQQKFRRMDAVKSDHHRKEGMPQDIFGLRMHHFPGHVQGHLDGRRMEKHPRPRDRVEEHKHRHNAVWPASPHGGDPFPPVQPQGHAVNHLHQPVQAAPEDERPHGAVPQPGDEHGRHEVDIRPDRSLAVAAQRYVDVVADPAGQRDVPAAPELGGAGAQVR